MLVAVVKYSLLFMSVMIVAVVLLRENAPLLPGHTAGEAATERQHATGRAAQRARIDESLAADGSELVIEAGPGGHYYVDAEVDGRDIGFLVDTGATMVALTRSDAETLGYDLDQLTYSGRANTANGVARFARVVLQEIVIDGNIIKDVPGVVIDAPMNKSLLGMTFLRRLAGFEIKDEHLILRW